MNNKVFVRIMCVVLGVLMLASAVALIASGFITSCAA